LPQLGQVNVTLDSLTHPRVSDNEVLNT
jgi:hypothetical protein